MKTPPVLHVWTQLGCSFTQAMTALGNGLFDHPTHERLVLGPVRGCCEKSRGRTGPVSADSHRDENMPLMCATFFFTPLDKNVSWTL